MMAVHLTKLQFFEDGSAQSAVELGLISPSVFMRFIHYKIYQDLIQEGYNQTQSIQIISDRTKASLSTVRRGIFFFSEHRKKYRKKKFHFSENLPA